MALKDALPRAAANRETRLEALALEDCQVGELGAQVGHKNCQLSTCFLGTQGTLGWLFGLYRDTYKGLL